MTSPQATAGSYSVYTGRVSNWPMVVLTSVLGIALVANMTRSSGNPGWAAAVPLALAALGVALNGLTSSSVRATAGPNGLTVRWGILGWPRSRYPLTSIARTEVIDLPWWRVSWGFWWTPKRTCCTLRSGKTLRLVLGNGRTLTLSVNDPAAAVAAIEQARRSREN